MCGIVGSIGLNNPRNYIIDGLKTLEYRGYDSAGVAFLDENITIIKDKGSIDHLNGLVPTNIASIAIGHTRWATHGAPTKENSHPHLSFHGIISIVHNGVIENYREIKQMLVSNGYDFYGQTDTEVVANLLEYFYLSTKDFAEAIREAIKTIRGSYAIVAMNKDEKDKLFIMKNSSPLLVGITKEFNLVSSDASAMIKYTNLFIELEDEEYGILTKDSVRLFDVNGKAIVRNAVTKNLEDLSTDLHGYPHYMLKEIEEIEPIINRQINEYFDGEKYTFDPKMLKDIDESDHIIFIACGTSYHAALVGGRLFEDCEKSTTKFIASEWAFHPVFAGKKPFIILISQSGETADLIHCLKIIKERNIPTLIITNTEGSTLDRGCTYSLLLHAGKEVAVASTKAYVAQVELLSLIAGALRNDTNVIEDLKKTISINCYIRDNCKDKIKEIAMSIKDFSSVFFLGRGYDSLLSYEASLKLKEITYIHSEAIPGGELKHGPIALIEKDTPVIVFITDKETAASMRGNIEEVKARGAKVYVVSTKSLSHENDSIVVEDYPYYLSSVAISAAAFYLAYFVSLFKGLNVDKPRNLAKSVTVE